MAGKGKSDVEYTSADRERGNTPGNSIELNQYLPIGLLKSGIRRTIDAVVDMYTGLGTPPPLVSLHTDNGIFESCLIKKVPYMTEIICVESRFNTRLPVPESLIDRACMCPHVDNVRTLVDVRTDLIGNCCLLIKWPPGVFEDTDKSADLMAIAGLRPIRVVAIIDTTGESGSYAFLTYLNMMGLMTTHEMNSYISPLLYSPHFYEKNNEAYLSVVKIKSVIGRYGIEKVSRKCWTETTTDGALRWRNSTLVEMTRLSQDEVPPQCTLYLQ